ncbi:hypothetical protein LTR86_008879 [Recurvomyces mirabilis]|nr:hypothetical protein LTR86_008879 [Recurvomyces mirabilis]
MSTSPTPSNSGGRMATASTTPKTRKSSADPANDNKNNDKNFGFIGPHPKRRPQRMRWTEKNDIKLLLFGFDRDEIKGSEYQGIADSFVEKPTRKSVVERMTKLRAERNGLLRELGVWDIDEEGVGGGGGNGGDAEDGGEGYGEVVGGSDVDVDEDAEGLGRG